MQSFATKTLQPLRLENVDQYQRSTLIAPRSGTGLPNGYGLKQVRLLGKGSNNAVYLYNTRSEQLVVYRQPRRKSDTQKLGNATWEFRNTAIAVQIGVTPLLYDAWYNRHKTTEQMGGLHMICEYFPKDLHAILVETPARVFPHRDVMRQQITSHLRKMADANLFCYDLKPSNMVFKDNPVDVRFIDFGRDFCEWRQYSPKNEFLERAPVLSYIQTLADQNADSKYKAEALYKDLMFAAMLILLSANFGFTLDQSNTATRQGLADNVVLNFMGDAAKELRSCTRGKHVSLIQDILRQRDIRDTLRHYIGRRNCGTKRCFTYAGFL